jgi:hypothetical protein
MDTRAVIQSQYLAALEMLHLILEKCPDALWDRAEDKNRFWQVAYHTLFYAHLYLQPSLESSVPWAKRRKGAHNLEDESEPYRKEELLEYLDFCREQVRQQVPLVDLDAPSGFEWLAMNKLELQLYNLRHIQQHIGELSERLGKEASLDVDWVDIVTG